MIGTTIRNRDIDRKNLMATNAAFYYPYTRALTIND